MEGLKPGRIVYFVLDENAKRHINRRYDDANSQAGIEMMMAKSGAQIHVGSRVLAGDVCPAMVTAVRDGDVCNLKVMLDGNDTYWATSIPYADNRLPGSWHWMFEGQQTRYKPDRVEAPV